MDLPENEGSKLFQDSVHGVMKFHKLIVNFIDTRQVQRLRNIKQLSTTYLVYPAAAHNRFEHSLGVCWLAGKLLRKLEINSPKEWAEIFSSKEEGKSLVLAVQIAGLLHDLGHGPFSHTWESFVKACGHDWDHEQTSCGLIDLMLWKDKNRKDDKNLTALGEHFKAVFTDVKKYATFIKKIITGEVSDNKKMAFLYEVVANKFNDIDIDKWDYFLRDAQHLNMSVSFDYRRLIYLSKIKIIDGTSHIAFRDAERYSIQSMFRVRADLHIRAYQHRVAKCLEAMLIDALKEADKHGYKVRGTPLSKVHMDAEKFSQLTDSIQEILYNSEEDYLASTRQILDRMATRKLYETVLELTLNVKQTPEEEKENRTPNGISREKLTDLEKELGQKFAISQVCINQGKYYDPMKRVIFYPKPGRDINEKNVPAIHMSLPFYKLYVFKRVQEEHDVKHIEQTVYKFLTQEHLI